MLSESFSLSPHCADCALEIQLKSSHVLLFSGLSYVKSGRAFQQLYRAKLMKHTHRNMPQRMLNELDKLRCILYAQVVVPFHKADGNTKHFWHLPDNVVHADDNNDYAAATADDDDEQDDDDDDVAQLVSWLELGLWLGLGNGSSVTGTAKRHSSVTCAVVLNIL